MAGPIHEFSHLPRPKRAASSAWRANRAARAEGAPPTVGLIYNPRSHHNKGQDLTSTISPDIFVAQPGNRDQLPEALARLAERGIEVREWQMDPGTGHLDPEDLQQLLDEKVRLVCFPHCSNVVGEINPVVDITALAHAAGAFVCVDGPGLGFQVLSPPGNC